MTDVFLKNNSARGVSDRAQRIAYWVSIAGLIVNTFLFGLYVLNDSLTALLIVNYAYYTTTISVIALSSYFNWHFSKVLSWGIAAIYVHMWATTFHDAWVGHASTLSFPILLFVPLCLVLVSSYRVLMAYAGAQFLLVSSYGKFFLGSAYGFNPERVDTTTLAILLAVMSSLTLLVLSIVAYSRQKTDTRLLGLVKETERLAAQDPLTGLKNRRAFMDDVEKLWTARTPFSIVFIDLDRFKPLNDEYGHGVGDAVLQSIGTRLNTAPQSLTTARFGGDEFAVLLEEQPADADLHSLVEHLHRIVVSEIDVEIAKVCVGASLGYARAVYDGFAVSELLHAADTAMRRSKSNGGGVAKFDPQIDDASLASSAVEELFRKALRSGKVQPALQPIVDARTRSVIGHEMLARWHDSGLARDPSPVEFIPVAEKLGLLNELLWTTLRAAIPIVRQGGGFLAINVSPSQLSSSSFLEELQSLADSLSFSMRRIEIEITEHVAFRNLDENIKVLEAIRARGCRIVLDDFGSGYSSLSLLEELPLDKVKLDKSLQGRLNKRGVLQATIRLARDLGFECCVEGVETQTAATFAAQQGCDQMQGYWFGHPEIVTRPLRTLSIAS